MKFNCLFCGKEVVGDPYKSQGFCNDCELAKNFAVQMEKSIINPIPKFHKKNGTEIVILDLDPEEFWKKVRDAWLDSILYGDNNAQAYELFDESEENQLS